MERKVYLSKAVGEETARMALSKYIEGQGMAFYTLAKQQDMEGIVAKRKDSFYIEGKRTKDWIKIKNLIDDDFVVCGYIFKDNNMISVVLGQYEHEQLIYKGHVTLGVGGENFQRIKEVPQIPSPLFASPLGNENAIWIEPQLVCVVKFMEYTANGGMRQPVFKGLRPDKLPKECRSRDGMGGI